MTKLKAIFKAVLATYGTTTDALLDVVTGKFNPSGTMPFSTLISDEAVTNQKEDVPSYLAEKGYSLFNYNEGLRYKYLIFSCYFQNYKKV